MDAPGKRRAPGKMVRCIEFKVEWRSVSFGPTNCLASCLTTIEISDTLAAAETVSTVDEYDIRFQGVSLQNLC